MSEQANPGETLDIRIPHRLGRAAAKQQIDAGFEKAMGSSLTGGVADVRQHWENDRLVFQVKAMGQVATGTADVHDDNVQLSIVLPWFLKRLADTIRPKVEKATRKLLEKK